MTRSTIAFIDHPFHRKTRSSNFFVELLSKTFDVHVFYLEPDPRALMREIADAGYRLAVCWQTEFCAPYFLMRGMRVVCVPMYDGVAHAPDWYWLAMRQARFINFSRQLHERLRAMGIESFYTKYFDEPIDGVPQAKFDELRGFFWQRRPEEGLDYKFARHLIGDVVTALHIHNAPDTARPEDWRPDGTCTVSHFTEDGRAYRDGLEQANVFLCPRKSEGIGHSLIEAMARGMCVIAHDEPTANEYIVDGLNGMLADYGQPVRFQPTGKKHKKYERYLLSPTLAEKLGKTAREHFLFGYKQWRETAQQLPFLIHSAPEPDLTSREKRLAEVYLSICKYAHRDFPHYLHLLLQLHRRGLRGQEASTIRLSDIIERETERIPGVVTLKSGARRVRALFR